DVVIHEEGLAYGARIGHAGRLDDDPVEVQISGLALVAQLAQDAREIAAHGAADAAIVHLDDLLAALLDEKVVVDALRSKFVFDDGNTLTMLFGKNAIEQRGFAGAKESGQNGDRNHAFGNTGIA